MKIQKPPFLAYWFAIGLLTACASLGIVPQTFNQRLAVGYGAVTAVRQTALTLGQAGKISADDAQNIENQADNVRAALDISRAVSKSNTTQADAKLSSALVALQALSSYLEKQK